MGLKRRKNLDDDRSENIEYRLRTEQNSKEGKMPKERFEDALNKLEKVVSKLEEGDIPLEDSLKLFEEGIRLSRFCNQKLDEAEKRVEILMKDKEGNLRPQLFESSGDSENTVQPPSEEED